MLGYPQSPLTLLCRNHPELGQQPAQDSLLVVNRGAANLAQQVDPVRLGEGYAKQPLRTTGADQAHVIDRFLATAVRRYREINGETDRCSITRIEVISRRPAHLTSSAVAAKDRTLDLWRDPKLTMTWNRHP